MRAGKKLIASMLSLMLVCAFGLLAGCAGQKASGDNAKTTTADSAKTTTAPAAEYKLVEKGKLTIGSDCDYPPFIYLEGEKPAGFEKELMDAISKKMGLECNYLAPQKFDTLIPMISTNEKMDIGVSSFTITEERLKEIDFTDSYFDSNQAVVTLKSSSYKTAKDMAGKKIGAQSGTTGESWARENIPGCELVAFDAITESMQALMAGKVEAVVFDLPAAVEMVNGSFTNAQILLEVPTGEQYGIVVSKSNPNLTIAINKALAELRADGTYDTLYKKYFEY